MNNNHNLYQIACEKNKRYNSCNEEIAYWLSTAIAEENHIMSNEFDVPKAHTMTKPTNLGMEMHDLGEFMKEPTNGHEKIRQFFREQPALDEFECLPKAEVAAEKKEEDFAPIDTCEESMFKEVKQPSSQIHQISEFIDEEMQIPSEDKEVGNPQEEEKVPQSEFSQ